MKKIFKTVAFLLASAYAFAQAPQSFNYQGLARDNSGAAMATKTISVKATILDGTATGTSVYSETFSASTNAFGLFTLGIGSGTPVAGTFSAIKWSSGNKFLKIEIDPNGGSSYALSGTTQLLSVPYAMYAASAGDSKWSDVNGGINYSGGKVGIGTSTPISALSIKGDFTGDDRALISLNNTSTAASSAAGIAINSVNEGVGLYVYSSNYYPNLLPWQTGRTVLGSSAKNGIRFDAGNKSTSNIEFALGPDIAISGETKRPLRMIITNSGNVGFGTESPSATLHTNGTVRLQGLTSNSTLTNALVTDANGNVYTKDISTLVGSQWANVTGGISYNSGNVGIGTTTPLVNFQGQSYPSNTFEGIHIKTTKKVGTLMLEGANDTRIHFASRSNANENIDYVLGTGGAINNFALYQIDHSNGYIKSILTANENGNLIIGDQNIGTTVQQIAKAKLHISSGDVYLDDATKGIIMKNASGQCYRVTVGTAGALVSTLVTCP